ncbi:MAG TPA: M42 family metallopeptidase [Thermoflexia bacterium]|nr:M42 family metallopeptidase [Thermoflexia bacterium]
MILKELSEAFGPSGNERPVRQILRQALEGHVDRMWVDALGNLHTEKQGTGEDRLRVLVTAHMDEIGLMVVGHDDDGTLKVRAIGGIDPRVLPGAQVLVGPDRLPGVIGLKPVHLLKEGEADKVATIDQLRVDIGAKGKEEAKNLAPVGAVVVFATRFRELGPTVMGKSFDDRVGCAVLVELLRGERFPHDLHAVFTVQEEVGLRGARVAAYAACPDCGFALEGTIADDLPKEKDVSPTTELGKGPAITVMDRTFIAHRGLNRLLVETAEELGIPCQFKQPGIGGTDSGAVHLAREGVPCATVAVPCRYIHSPASLLSLADFENTVRLMREALNRLRREHVGSSF